MEGGGGGLEEGNSAEGLFQELEGAIGGCGDRIPVRIGRHFTFFMGCLGNT